MTLKNEFNLDRVKINHHVHYSRSKVILLKVIVRTSTLAHAHSRPTAVPGPQNGDGSIQRVK